MKKTVMAGLVLGTITIIQSCAPVYRCGDPIPEKKPGGKRMQAVITERDSLCTSLAEQKAVNQNLRSDNKDLAQRLSNQQTINYDQADQFGKALQEKSRELQEKERLLREREEALRELQSVIARQDSITRHLNDVLRNALLGFNSDELSVEVKNGKVYVSLSDKLLFKSGSAAVEDKGKEALQVLAEVLSKNPDIAILVEGHTDNVPIKTAQYKDNWDLSVARATSITRILTETYSIDPHRLTAAGRGEYFPKASNDTPEGRAKNRRTEIILSPNLQEIMSLLNGTAGN